MTHRPRRHVRRGPPSAARTSCRNCCFDLPELQYPRNDQRGRLAARSERRDRQRRTPLRPGAGRHCIGRYRGPAGDVPTVSPTCWSTSMASIPGNRVLLRAPNTPMLAACWFAVLKAGGIAVTTMPLYRATELRFMLEKAQVDLALCDVPAAIDELTKACDGLGGVTTAYFGSDGSRRARQRAWHGSRAQFANVETAAEDVALIAFTSGTTGTPKAAMHYHRDILATCDTLRRARLAAAARRSLLRQRAAWDSRSGSAARALPVCGRRRDAAAGKGRPGRSLRAVAEYGVTTPFTAPIAYRTMCRPGRSLRSVDAADVRFGRRNAAEGGLGSVAREDRAEDSRRNRQHRDAAHLRRIAARRGSRRMRPAAPFPGTSPKCTTTTAGRFPPGTVGRLAVKGPTGCKYLDDERQRIYVQNGWNYPGDAYRMDEDGLPLVRRAHRRHDRVGRIQYFGAGSRASAHRARRRQRSRGRRQSRIRRKQTHIVKAFVVLDVDAAASGDEKADELQAFCKARIAPFKAPREIEFVSELPRTETGKLQRYKLRQKAATER